MTTWSGPIAAAGIIAAFVFGVAPAAHATGDPTTGADCVDDGAQDRPCPDDDGTGRWWCDDCDDGNGRWITSGAVTAQKACWYRQCWTGESSPCCTSFRF